MANDRNTLISSSLCHMDIRKMILFKSLVFIALIFIVYFCNLKAFQKLISITIENLFIDIQKIKFIKGKKIHYIGKGYSYEFMIYFNE